MKISITIKPSSALEYRIRERITAIEGSSFAHKDYKLAGLKKANRLICWLTPEINPALWLVPSIKQPEAVRILQLLVLVYYYKFAARSVKKEFKLFSIRLNKISTLRDRLAFLDGIEDSILMGYPTGTGYFDGLPERFCEYNESKIHRHILKISGRTRASL